MNGPPVVEHVAAVNVPEQESVMTKRRVEIKIIRAKKIFSNERFVILRSAQSIQSGVNGLLAH